MKCCLAIQRLLPFSTWSLSLSLIYFVGQMDLECLGLLPTTLIIMVLSFRLNGPCFTALGFTPYSPQTHYNPAIWVSFSLKCWHPVGFSRSWGGDLCQHIGLVGALAMCHVFFLFFKPQCRFSSWLEHVIVNYKSIVI
jgi:hypothetical protein